MQKYYQMPLALAGLSLITACGGASTGGADVTMETVSFDALMARSDVAAAYMSNGEEGLAITANNDLPTGTVSYTGVMSLAKKEVNYLGTSLGGFPDYTATTDYEAIGSATATVDFGTTGLTIVGSDFYEVAVGSLNSDQSEPTGALIAGQVTMNFTQDVAGENGYTGTATGSFTTVGGEDISVNVPGGGSFAGAGAEALFVEAWNDKDAFLPTEPTVVDEVEVGALLFKD